MPRDPAREAAAILEKKVPQLQEQVLSVKSRVAALPNDAEKAVAVFQDADNTLKLCLVKLRDCKPDMQKKYGKDIEFCQKYLNRVRAEVTSARDRSALLGDARAQPRATPTDPEGMMSEANRLEDENEQSLLRSLQATQQATEIATHTATTLDAQGEQIRRTHEKVKETDQRMDQADYLLRGIQSIGGAFRNLFIKAPTVGDTSTPASARARPAPAPAHTSHDREVQSARGGSQKPKNDWGGSNGGWGKKPDPYSTGGGGTGGGTAWGNTGGAVGGGGGGGGGGMAQVQQSRDRQDQHLDMISANLAQLKAVSLGIGNELDAQKVQLDELETDVDKVSGRIEKSDKKIRKILKK